jgi:ribonuclease Z
MKLVFLGTSAGAPTKARNVTAICLQWVQSGKLWLFDCGESTQHRFQVAPISLSKLEKVFITHLHGDHVFGLPGLMASRSAAQNAVGSLDIFGPTDLEEYLNTTLNLTHTRIKYRWLVESVVEGMIFEDEHCRVECRLLNHGIPSYGFAVTEKQQPGVFDPERAKELGITPGPDYGTLKSGRDIVLPNGVLVRSTDVVGASRIGRKVVICGDTAATEAAVELAAAADVLVHEATFMKDQTERAAQVGHSTTVQAATVAKRAGVGTLILTHFSPRYEQEKSNLMAELLAEATEIFPNTILAEDYLSFDIVRRH